MTLTASRSVQRGTVCPFDSMTSVCSCALSWLSTTLLLHFIVNMYM